VSTIDSSPPPPIYYNKNCIYLHQWQSQIVELMQKTNCSAVKATVLLVQLAMLNHCWLII
ncbi:MAG: hypothetical protein ACI959_000295, partial [Limisphaerales bacterium]